MKYYNKYQNNRKIDISLPIPVAFTDEERKINSLFLSANFLENLGLTNGKLGIALYFFSLYRRTHNNLYEDFAFELLEEVDSAINDRTLAGFRFGLCGIGWGIEFLVRGRYIGVDEDICARFEHRIQQFVLYDGFQGVGIANGLGGVLLYLLARIESSLVRPDSESMFTNKRFIIYVLDKLSLLLTPDSVRNLVREQDNDVFGKEIPLVLSNWDYPVLLWTLGRVALHRILREKTENLLLVLLTPLADESLLPCKDNNRELLKRVLNSLLMLESAVVVGVVKDIILKNFQNQTEVSRNEKKGIADVTDAFLRFTTEYNANVFDNHNG